MRALSAEVEESRMPYMTVGAENSGPIDLYYEDHGAGQPVVLIHGFPLSTAAWEKQIPALLGAGFRTIAYDRRGFGRSGQPATGYTYDTFAADLDVLMTELDLQDAVLIGHSMGTGEITRYIGRYGSGRVNRAVMISAIPPFLLKTPDNPDGIDQTVFDGFINAAKNDRFAYQTSFMNNFYNYDQTKGKQVSEEAFRANWIVAVTASPLGTVASIKSWMTDFRADLAAIDVPVLVIHGDADRVLPYPATAARLEQMLPGSRLVILPGAPHAIPWTHADEVNGAVLEFLAQRAPAMAR
jgi:non-heme chloroperoxidase